MTDTAVIVSTREAVIFDRLRAASDYRRSASMARTDKGRADMMWECLRCVCAARAMRMNQHIRDVQMPGPEARALEQRLWHRAYT